MKLGTVDSPSYLRGITERYQRVIDLFCTYQNLHQRGGTAAALVILTLDTCYVGSLNKWQIKTYVPAYSDLVLRK